MVCVEFDLPLQGGHVLSMHLKGQGPEVALPDETSLGILKSNVVFVINVRRIYEEVEVSDVEPEGNYRYCCYH